MFVCFVIHTAFRNKSSNQYHISITETLMCCTVVIFLKACHQVGLFTDGLKTTHVELFLQLWNCEVIPRHFVGWVCIRSHHRLIVVSHSTISHTAVGVSQQLINCGSGSGQGQVKELYHQAGFGHRCCHQLTPSTSVRCNFVQCYSSHVSCDATS